MITDRMKKEYSKKILPHRHSVCHKSHREDCVINYLRIFGLVTGERKKLEEKQLQANEGIKKGEA